MWNLPLSFEKSEGSDAELDILIQRLALVDDGTFGSSKSERSLGHSRRLALATYDIFKFSKR
jgi:hypothetical protein